MANQISLLPHNQEERAATWTPSDSVARSQSRLPATAERSWTTFSAAGARFTTLEPESERACHRRRLSLWRSVHGRPRKFGEPDVEMCESGHGLEEGMPVVGSKNLVRLQRSKFRRLLRPVEGVAVVVDADQ